MPIKNYQQLRKYPDHNKYSQVSHIQNLTVSVAHMRGWRKTMEDAHVSEFNIDQKGTHLFAIFDGHGGGQIAIFAKRHLKQLLTKNQYFQKQEYQKALQQVFPDLDGMMMKYKGSKEVFEIKEELQEQLAKQYRLDWEQESDEQTQCLAGSTALVCLMTKDNIYLASVGDSQCIICANKNQKVFFADHSPNNPDEKRRIETAGGKVKNNRVNGLLSMSRSIGDFRFKGKKNRPPNQQIVICDPYIETIPNQKIQFIMLGCDGVWEGKQIDWYFETIKQKTKNKQNGIQILQTIFDQVVAKDLKGSDGHDNMTSILIFNQSQN